MPSLIAQGIVFSFSDRAPLFTAASPVNLHLAPGWAGLVGENGAGKTTLLRLLAGELAPSRGAVHVSSNGGALAFCPQDDRALVPEVRRLAEDDRGPSRKLRSSLGLDPAALARWPTLSPGERKRWQVGAALATEPDVLLLDEPTNHLDEGARRWLMTALRAFAGVGLVVSHDRALLNELAVRTLRVHGGEVRLWTGGYDAARAEWLAEEDARGTAHTRARQVEQGLRRRLDEKRRAQAGAGASLRHLMKGPKDHDARGSLAKGLRAHAEKRHGRDVEVTRAKLERAEAERRRLAPAEKARGGAIRFDFEKAKAPHLLRLDCDALAAREGSPALLRDVHLSMRRGSRVHLAGPNGAGKTTLIDALLARRHLPEGKLLMLPQTLDDDASRALARSMRELRPEIRGRVLSMVAALGASPSRVLASEALSPGEGRKLAVAMGLGREAWALLLDEPTNHLDLPSIERLGEALAAYPGALLLVTHDARLASRVTNERWEIQEGRVVVSSTA